MTKKYLFIIAFLLGCTAVHAQQDTIALKEVVISDTQLRDFSQTQSVQKITDSVIGINQSSLTNLLQYNTVVYFKENGLGMVSSPSFRGTTAQQTAVVWNGININSQLNGQTDFNTVTTRDFNEVSVRAGGGSVIYGSSAIGGSIHLNDKVSFNQKFSNRIRANYGSYNTVGIHYDTRFATEKFGIVASVSRNSSDNDYDFADGSGHNRNGQYYNNSYNVTAGYTLNAYNTLRLYSYLYDGDRHFSLMLPSDTRTKYHDFNTRNMLEWVLEKQQFISKLKAAHLHEEYKYYPNIYNKSYTYGRVETIIGRYDVLYKFTDNIKLNAVADYSRNSGFGSDIIIKTRNTGALSMLFSHNVASWLLYEAGVRKEATDTYKSPLLYSAGVKLQPVRFYALKLNTSKNFRVPTFNDLYWQDGGNPDLKPESSWQAEAGNAFTFGNFNLSLTGYYIKLKDMLRWVPVIGVWRPMNTDRVTTKGLELLGNYKKQFGLHSLDAIVTYAYTRSEDDATGKQLIYVPYHKATGAVAYGYKRFYAYVQGLYNGEVFTRTDNNARYNLDAYVTANAGASYSYGAKVKYTLGVQLLNLANYDYASVDSRPMPGRNYMINLTLKF